MNLSIYLELGTLIFKITHNSLIYESVTQLQMLVYQSKIVPKWKIKTQDNYIVATDNNVYNLKTKKKLQMQLKQYTKGYYLAGRFYSLIQLRKHLVKIEHINCPF